MSAPLTVMVNTDVPSSLAGQIRDLSSTITVITRAEFRACPELLVQAEVLFTDRLDAARFATAPRLRWVQTAGAGIEWLLSPEVCERADLQLTNASGIHGQAIAEQVLGFMLMWSRNLHRAVRRQSQATGTTGSAMASVASPVPRWASSVTAQSAAGSRKLRFRSACE